MRIIIKITKILYINVQRNAISVLNSLIYLLIMRKEIFSISLL